MAMSATDYEVIAAALRKAQASREVIQVVAQELAASYRGAYAFKMDLFIRKATSNPSGPLDL